MAASGEQDLYDNADAKIRYEAYRCEFMRYEAYRWEDLRVCLRKPVNISTQFTTSIFDHQRYNQLTFCAVGFKLQLWHMEKACLYQKLLPLAGNLTARAACLRHFWDSGSTFGK